MEELIRTKVSCFELKDSLTLSQVQQLKDEGKLEEILVPIDEMFSDYEAVMLEEQATAIKVNKPVVKEEPKTTNKKKMTYSERLELQNIDQEIARTEAEIKMLGLEINGCGSDFVKLNELTKKQEEAQTRLDALVDRWAYLSELAEQKD